MSTDLRVWSKGPFHLQQQLSEADNWQLNGEEWTFEGDGWQLLVIPGNGVPEDLIVAKLPDAANVVYITLEPIGAPAEAYRLLEKITRSLAKSSGGVWVDLCGTPNFHDEGVF